MKKAKTPHDDEFSNPNGTFRKGYAQPWYYNSLYKRSGSNHYNWKGGRIKDKDDYILIYNPSHPNARVGGSVLEHRLVIEKDIGRYLKPWEVVHHKNGKRNDNRLENLELLPSQGSHNTAVQQVYKENKELKQTLMTLLYIIGGT